MAEITINLIHDLKEQRRARKAKPPFITGLRTGYVRTWIFVVLKVWLIVALMNGVTTMDRIEKDITLLDSYVHNDFSHPEVFFDSQTPVMLLVSNVHHKKPVAEKYYPPRVAGDVTPPANTAFEPRGPATL